MTQKRILHIPGHRHYVTFTTYKRRRFLNPARCRDIVVEVLQKALVDHHVHCAGFVVMTDHVHAILFGNEEFNASDFVKVWKKTTSYRIKRFYLQELPHYIRSFPNDPIWQAKFYDHNIDSDEKNNEKLDYMHHNPVAGGLSLTHVEWNWSSARHYELGESVGVTITP